MIGGYMKAKDKSKKNLKFSLKNILYFLAIIVILLYACLFYDLYFEKNKSYAKEVDAKPQEIKISNAEKIQVEDILENTIQDGKREEFVVEEVELEYLTKYQNNPELPKGMMQVVQEGREGKQQITKKRTYEKEQLVSEEPVNTKVTKASINKIVEIGTANYTSNYKVKVGDTLYVTSDRLSVMFEPNEQSEKLATLSKNDEIKLLQIDGEWYKIKNNITQGYVRAECTTYLNPNQKLEEESNTSQDTGTSKTKQQLISTLRFDMALNKPSGLSLEQFKKVLSDSKDTNKIFEKNAEYFYYIEKQYNINGIFVAAVGIHESAWGTSKIATSKMNLFGYGAYDSNPYNGAYHFSNYSECIDLIARVFVKYYLNPKGTEIYGGEKAQGTYYNGATLSGVNTKYATDKNWANGVYSHMKYLYNKL